MRQINLEVSSFLSNPFLSYENTHLPNDVIMLRNIGEGHEVHGERHGGGDQQGHPSLVGGLAQLEFKSASLSRSSPR